MLFNSYLFLFLFLPITLIGFFLTARFSRHLASGWLVAASFVFYGWWNPFFCILLSISIVFNYGASRLIAGAEARPGLQRMILVSAIAIDLGALVYYKYLGWLVGLLDDTGLFSLNVPSVALPLGISFFTFTQIGYLVDCMSGSAEDRNPLNYLLFVTFFPHLIAGPILHNQEIMPQFADARTYRFSAANLAVGSGIFVLGLLKKCVLADPVSYGVADAFAHPQGLLLFSAWQAALSYSLQLYFDFSGYSDMAIGLARMFNVRFPLNFNSPYKSASVIEYWQRWHMTLTRYLTQYVYSPVALAVMRRRRLRKLPINREAQQTPGGFGTMIAFPIVLTMGLAGIWHGSGAQFLVFGLLHGFYLCVNHAWRLFFSGARPTRDSVIRRVGCIALTYLCVLVGAIFFRAPSVSSAVSMLGGMIGLHGIGPTVPLPSRWVGQLPGADSIFRPADWKECIDATISLVRIAVLYLIVWFMPNTQQIFARYSPAIEQVQPGPMPWLRWRMSAPWAVAFGCATVLAILSIGGTSEFLYFAF
jgi:alginate O-acetyltransferase complex protein AlgI